MSDRENAPYLFGDIFFTYPETNGTWPVMLAWIPTGTAKLGVVERLTFTLEQGSLRVYKSRATHRMSRVDFKTVVASLLLDGVIYNASSLHEHISQRFESILGVESFTFEHVE